MLRFALFLLPILGLVVSAAAAIWGLTQELYSKDQNNKRHLTQAGKYAIAFTLAGLVISLNTAVLKDLSERQQRAESRQKSEAEERRRTLQELQRTTTILRGIRRTQFPLTASVRLGPILNISIDQPELKPTEPEVSKIAAKLLTQGASGDLNRVFDLVPVYMDDWPVELPTSITHVELDVWIFRRGAPIDSVGLVPDISAMYYVDMQRGVQEGNVHSGGTMSYAARRRHYRIVAPHASIGQFFRSSGRLASVLDLPGATLIIACDGFSDGCRHVELELLTFEVAPGLELQIRGKDFEKRTVVDEVVLVHRFHGDEDTFIERYHPQ